MCIDSFTSALLSLAGAVWQLFNSSFAIAFIGGFVGAIGGALGAQHIAERSKRRDELMKELRNVNTAIMASFSICNSALALKEQHVQPIHKMFSEVEEGLKTFERKRKAGQLPPNMEFEFEANFKTFSDLTTPIEALKDIVYSKMSTHGRPLALTSVIEQSLIGLREVIVQRNNLIQRFENRTIPRELFAEYYFGLSLPDGSINQKYPDIIKAIYSYTDDVAFFSALLCDDLVLHGNEVRDEYIKKYKKGAPKISTADFSTPRDSGLIPPDSQYESWLKGFTKL